jgi:hypothetical protein
MPDPTHPVPDDADDERKARRLLAAFENYAQDSGGFFAQRREADCKKVVALIRAVRAETPERWSDSYDALNEKATAMNAELRRAMAVVDAVFQVEKNEGFCPLCDNGATASEGEPPAPHDADCPLVAQGFITPDGRRVERG